jgi:hypothetical protein
MSCVDDAMRCDPSQNARTKRLSAKMTHFMTQALIAKHGDAPAAKLEDEKRQRIEGHDGVKGIHPSSRFLFGITEHQSIRV